MTRAIYPLAREITSRAADPIDRAARLYLIRAHPPLAHKKQIAGRHGSSLTTRQSTSNCSENTKPRPLGKVRRKAIHV
jgi:hypothetical protein